MGRRHEHAGSAQRPHTEAHAGVHEWACVFATARAAASTGRDRRDALEQALEPLGFTLQTFRAHATQLEASVKDSPWTEVAKVVDDDAVPDRVATVDANVTKLDGQQHVPVGVETGLLTVVVLVHDAPVRVSNQSKSNGSSRSHPAHVASAAASPTKKKIEKKNGRRSRREGRGGGDQTHDDTPQRIFDANVVCAVPTSVLRGDVGQRTLEVECKGQNLDSISTSNRTSTCKSVCCVP